MGLIHNTGRRMGVIGSSLWHAGKCSSPIIREEIKVVQTHRKDGSDKNATGQRSCSASVSRERVWVKVKTSQAVMLSSNSLYASNHLLVPSKERIRNVLLELDRFDEFDEFMGDDLLTALHMQDRRKFVPLTSDRMRHANILCPADFDCEMWERHSIVTVSATDLYGKTHVLNQWTFVEEPHSTFSRMYRKAKEGNDGRRQFRILKDRGGRGISLQFSLSS
eukprot:453886-Hanusia_phi.AAC.2